MIFINVYLCLCPETNSTNKYIKVKNIFHGVGEA